MRGKRSVQVLVPHKAISTNQLHMGTKTRSWDYKKFRKEVFQFLEDNHGGVKPNLQGNLVFTLEVGFSNPTSDLSNSIKGIEDVLAEFYEFNDKQIVRIVMDKYIVNKGDEYMSLSLRHTKKNIDRRTRYVKGKKA
jgi:Holliday junction resolvase RusA-like endonuclease